MSGKYGDNRGYTPRNFGFTRDPKGSRTRQVHPDNDRNEVISMNLPDKTSSSHTNLQSSDKFLQTNKNTQAEKKVSLNKSSISAAPTKRLLVAGGVLLGISILITLPTVLAVILTRNPKVPVATSTSTAAPPYFTVYWGFDNDPSDLYGLYNGSLVNGAAFSNTTYFGYGNNLLLSSALNQSVIITSPFLNLTYTSFTVEAWIYGYSLTGDNAIFGQCQCSSCVDRCLYLIIRNYKMYMGFTLDDIIGSTSLTVNTWYHVAYVYDYSSQTQYLYLQGVLDARSPSSGPYLGANGSTTIGSSILTTSSFNGLIDNLKLTTRAKSAAEILSDATLVAYFSFDGATLSQDMGPNQMNGTLSNTALVSGRVGQALSFSGATASYFQLYGLYQLGQSNKPFSFSMWVDPYSINGGVLIYKTTLQLSGGTWCLILMGLNYVGQIIMVINTAYQPVIVGPVLSVRAWTHLGYTYSQTYGLRMYINGVLFGSTGALSWSSSGVIDWLTIGTNLIFCSVGCFTNTPFLGAIDEFYIYRRELSSDEISAYANP